MGGVYNTVGRHSISSAVAMGMWASGLEWSKGHLVHILLTFFLGLSRSTLAWLSALSLILAVSITYIHITGQVNILVSDVIKLEGRETKGITLVVDGRLNGFKGTIFTITASRHDERIFDSCRFKGW